MYVFRCLFPSTEEGVAFFLGSLEFAFYSLGTSCEACLPLQWIPLGECWERDEGGAACSVFITM